MVVKKRSQRSHRGVSGTDYFFAIFCGLNPILSPEASRRLSWERRPLACRVTEEAGQRPFAPIKSLLTDKTKHGRRIFRPCASVYRTSGVDLALELYYDLYFDGGIFGKTGDSNRSAGVFAGFAVKSDKEITGSVDHGRTVGKAADSVNVSADVDESFDGVQRTGASLNVGYRVQRAGLGRFITGLYGLLLTDLAEVRHLAVERTDRAREIK